MPRVVSFIVLVGILLFIAAMFFKVMAQFVLPLFLAAVLVVVFKPLHIWVREQLPGRLRISALVTTTLIMLTVLLPTAWLGWNAYLEGRDVFTYLKDPENRKSLEAKLGDAAASAATVLPFLDVLTIQPDAGTAAAAANDAAASDPTATTVELPPTVEPGAAADQAAGAGETPTSVDAEQAQKKEHARLNSKIIYDYVAAALGGVLLDSVQGLLSLLFGLIIMVLALYYFLVDGPSMIHTMMRLSPLDNAYERELLDRFANVSRAVVLAVLLSAVVQGLLAAVGFYFALEPTAPIFLLTMITMVLAVVPFVGAAGVWIPTCLWVFFYQGERIVDGVTVTGNPVAAIGLAIYCALVVSTIDNVIKPLVLHGQSNLHPLLALMSVLGGVKALGPVGIIVGPMLVAFIHSLLVMVNKELRLLGSPTPQDPFDKSTHLDPNVELEADAATTGSVRRFLERLAGSDVGHAPSTPAAAPAAAIGDAQSRPLTAKPTPSPKSPPKGGRRRR